MTSTQKQLEEKVRELIKDRPYFICRVADNHTELFGFAGRQTNQYSRYEDRINEEYLEKRFIELIKADRQALIEQILAEGPEDMLRAGFEEIEPDDFEARIEINRIQAINQNNTQWRTLLQKHKEGAEDARSR